jgi:amino acid transporter
MLLLIGSGMLFFYKNGLSVFHLNFALPVKGGSASRVIFFGFSAAMLGISGFESSANFVEEQKKGVFPKTLRNMWLAITILNPVIALLALSLVPLPEVEIHKESLLSFMAGMTGGKWLATIISVNAVTVLSGAVLTSFVGVNGLIRRMTLDRILPQFLLKENKRGSSYRILITFFILCTSVLFVTDGELAPLAGVYTISFLSVMAFFALGNLLLKIRRSRLPRPEYAKPLMVIVALFSTALALYGNLKRSPIYLIVFLQYFVPAMLLIYSMLNRNHIMEFLLEILKAITEKFRRFTISVRKNINQTMFSLHQQEFIFFSKADDVATLNKVMMYVEENEITKKIKIVTLLKDNQKVPEQFLKDLEVLDRAYPNLHIEFLPMEGIFNPNTIEELSKKWNIPKNFMFISSPGEKFSYKVEELGGVRLIL